MLLKYMVSNFKSISDTLIFSMIPTEDHIDKQYYNTIKTESGEIKVLKRSMLFGANASGKTSFIESIEFAKNFIVDGQKSRQKIQIEQFKGYTNDENISVFQFIFLLNDKIYEYGFSLNTEKVYEEWLILWDNNSKSDSIFERTTDENNQTEININFSVFFTTEESELITILKNSIKEQQKNQLFLNKLSENGISLAEDIVSWFDNITVIKPNSKFKGLELKLDKDENFAEFLSKALYEFDTGIKNVKTEKRKFPLKELLMKMNVDQEKIDEIYQKRNGIIDIGGKMFLFTDNGGETLICELKLEHNLKGKTYPFNKKEESDGTKRLLDLLPVLFLEKNNQGLFIIDELDRSFHTLITKEFLKRFLINSQNTQNQIIMTAHDVNVIDLSEVSNQEIWFFNKNNDGATSIKPLSNFKLKEGYNAEFAYLAGRFGGIPTIKGAY